jgi:ABC-type phosphate/phosphonate transport system substrate-binding protein
LRSLVAVLALVTGLVLPPIAFAQSTDVPRVAAIADKARTGLQRHFESLGAFRKQATGPDVPFIPVTDYAGQWRTRSRSSA